MFVFPLVMIIFTLQNSLCLSVPSNETQTFSSSEKLVYEKWMNIDKMLKGFVNSGLKKLLPVMLDFSNRVNLSSICVKQGLRLLSGIKRLDTWAISFMDASGKSIDGLLSSTIASYGDSDQCLSTVAKRKEGSQEVVMFKGKYCVLEFKPPLPEKKDEYFKHGITGLINATKSASGLIRDLASAAHGFYAESLHLGICVPSGCSIEDIDQIAVSVAAGVNIDARARYCEERNFQPLTTGTIVAISVYGLLVLLALGGTVLAYYFQKKNIKFDSKTMRSFLGFSISKNSADLLKSKLSRDDISCLHGIRFLTVTWIVFCHTIVFSMRVPQLHHHMIELFEATKRFGMQIVVNFNFSVDTFFLLGGLVNCYVSVKDEEKNRSRSFLYSIKHRLWRILPTYITVMLAFQFLQRIIKGPSVHSPVFKNLDYACHSVWWRNLLFINNYWPSEHSCLPHSWYLAAEFQLYVFSWGIIQTLCRFPRIGLALNALLIGSSAAFSITWTEMHEIHPMFITTDPNPQQFERVDNWYRQTVVHAGPYFVGVLTGYMLAKKKEVTMSKFSCISGWLLATLVATSVLFSTKKWNNGMEPTKVEDILYSGFSKLGFSLSIAWVIICCARGYGGIINTILSWKFWVPLSRLVFGIYLVSPLVQMSSIGSWKIPREVSTKEWVWRFLADYFVSIFLASLLYLFVENPFINIEKIWGTKNKNLCVEQRGENNNTSKDGDCFKIDEESSL